MATFKLTSDQENAIAMVLARYNINERFCVIAGAAGVGKTTIVPYIEARLPLDEGEIAHCAYTGCAVEVLKRKGVEDACTIHRLIYNCHIDEETDEIKVEKKEAIAPKVVFIDEFSMVPDDMWKDLLSYKDVFYICLGDPAQLPPIVAEGAPTPQSYQLLQKPHYMMTEITRQAAESDIIQMTLQLRDKGVLPQSYKGNDIQIFQMKDFDPSMILWADQTICSMNKTRTFFNNKIREMLELPPSSVVNGDKMICLKNYWSIINGMGNALVNGMTGIVSNIQPGRFKGNPTIKVSFQPELEDNLQNNFLAASASEFNIALDKQFLETGTPCMRPGMVANMTRKRKMASKVPLQFDYGYCMTVHKSQGSQWDKVLVFEEDFPYQTKAHNQSLYTALTRAAKKVVLIRNQ